MLYSSYSINYCTSLSSPLLSYSYTLLTSSLLFTYSTTIHSPLLSFPLLSSPIHILYCNPRHSRERSRTCKYIRCDPGHWQLQQGWILLCCSLYCRIKCVKWVKLMKSECWGWIEITLVTFRILHTVFMCFDIKIYNRPHIFRCSSCLILPMFCLFVCLSVCLYYIYSLLPFIHSFFLFFFLYLIIQMNKSTAQQMLDSTNNTGVSRTYGPMHIGERNKNLQELRNRIHSRVIKVFLRNVCTCKDEEGRKSSSCFTAVNLSLPNIVELFWFKSLQNTPPWSFHRPKSLLSRPPQ